MDASRAVLSDAIAALRIRSATSFSWFGAPSPRLPRRIADSLDPRLAKTYLTGSIQARLYNQFYIRGRPVPATPHSDLHPDVGLTDFVRQLSAANRSRFSLDSGWSITRRGNGVCTVTKDALTLLVPTQAVEQAQGEEGPVTVRVPKECFGFSPGFYVALGERELVRDGSVPLLRVYWNIAPDAAASLVTALTVALNEATLPFMLKVLNDARRFTRCDAAVLYVPTDKHDAMHEAVRPVHRALAGALGDAIPAFTLRLAPGLGLAEDPGTGESFGMHRCRLVAEALVAAHAARERSAAARLARVEAQFREAGLDLDRPHLRRADADDRYAAWPTFTPPEVEPPSTSGSGAWLEAAGAIGMMLAGSAVWHGERCTWLGPEPMAGHPHGETVHRTLGPGLYSGLAGIAWFLAELAARSGEAQFAATARAALLQARHLAATVPADARVGLFPGWSGIAVAAARAGAALGDELLTGMASELAAEIARFPYADAKAEHDVMSGSAGAILALSELSRHVAPEVLGDAASSLGHRLCEAATIRQGCASWGSPAERRNRHLCGYSHGAAGIAAALVRLFDMTGERRFADTAARALAYERRFYAAEEGNWADLRGVVAGGPRGTVPRAYPAFWCHGAPGIALSRVHAHAVLGCARSGDEARAALASTRAALRAALRADRADLCLCHGACGNADVVLYCEARRDGGEEGGQDLARAVGHAAVRRLGLPQQATGANASPGLMQGLAGVGMFLLRLHAPGIPSPLALGLPWAGEPGSRAPRGRPVPTHA
ncbi:lanthionine synthetase LanC family protein [Elioraea rosea]|uniref:lanthionine synthetase LanC family protein n=1 Tax=Elioraea rosea TaxID=2492390 RepID=UPI0011846499|nr:lanthionine synthetase LanC family protein [Elioraea rosea]